MTADRPTRNTARRRAWPVVAAALSLLGACGAEAEERTCLDLLQQCGLTCDADAILGGNGAISSVPSIDAYLMAVASFDSQAAAVTERMQVALQRMALSEALVPLASADASAGALSGTIAARLDGRVIASYAPPRCEISAAFVRDLLLKCDPTLDPARAWPRCECDPPDDTTAACTGRCLSAPEAAASSVECEASVMAEAALHIECTPPSLDLSYAPTVAVALDPQALAELDTWVELLKRDLRDLTLLLARAEAIRHAGATLLAAQEPVGAVIETAGVGAQTMTAAVGLACALVAMPEAARIIETGLAVIDAQSATIRDLMATFEP